MSEPRSVANVEAAKAWDGDDGDHWTEHEDRYNATIRPYGRRLHDAAYFSPTDRVLDIGCGCGASTRDAARSVTSGRALGIDLSSRMLARARERAVAEGLTNATFEQGDAQVHPFEPGAFDLAMSRTGAMFFIDPVVAFANIGRALRPGGRLALLAWRDLQHNEWISALRDALAVGRSLPEPPLGAPGPFGLADPDTDRRILTEAGFDAIELEAVEEPFVIGADAEDAFGFVRTLGMTRGLTEGLDEAERARALDSVRATLAAHETDAGVRFGSAAWIVTARRA